MNVQFKIWRGDAKGGAFRAYNIECTEGMVVLDAVHQIQATQARDLACRWNCKAGKCGSCSAEVNGMPKLMCMTRLSDLPLENFRSSKIWSRMFHGIFGLRKRSNSSSRDRPTRRTAHGECSRRTSIVCRNSGNASNVFFARTFATCSVITKCTKDSSAHVS